MGAPTDDPTKVNYKDRNHDAARTPRRTEYLNLMRSMTDPLRSGVSEGDLHKDEYKWKVQQVYRVYEPNEKGEVEVLFVDQWGEFSTAFFGGKTGKQFLYVSEGW